MAAYKAGSVFKKSALAGATGAMLLVIPVVSHFEGKLNSAYIDPVGVPTICYGHTEGVRLGQVMTDEECDALLAYDLGVYISGVEALVTVPMPDTRKAALTSFAYNVGLTNLMKSTLLKKLNKGETVAACNELRKWVYAKGKKLPGLVKRREAERELCLVGTTEET